MRGHRQKLVAWDDLTPQMVLSMLSFEPKSGVFTWLFDRGNDKHSGSIAGSRDPRGYIRIHIFGGARLAHRLAWLVIHGRPIPDQIDHIDRDKSNNAIENLRATNSSQNQFNALNKGFFFHRADRKFQASIKMNGKTTYLGNFDTEDEARAAYVKAHIRAAKEFSPYLQADRPLSWGK